ncbi:putative serine/threonine-protein kinase-like protein CCR3 [Brachypodium distachyon]|nr:putative serine/threonine-protein kinase-like protein CCR3 [Brachypodium distachyon]XP_024311163.1 putative serine/threonine-protein kinase-like protein CCR3 [Brachypodium distachyon]XP_024311164.1 putative serine/threonine-protein kinase-like protein CCR3 [Brachypodium distachyon]KQJ87372.1 hypothetical protein BRADI_4g10610v3 [Brachypodium distachyon]KQJ87373.1 hypothetical protein BRADI_4g10610v3 [Brachypodium distachyon]PNT63032.1 hypothetical protein BRADI_4g10610v3 [Brachypodium dista|eukprot:XP_003577260.1 putative serine/threonine-protein kinase-like protein CCR3 [Brachypodium distachyon]
MALWTGLGQAATVAQLVGADIGGLISTIMQAALTARQNKRECEQLARRVLMIAELMPHLQLQDPEAVRPLAGLGDTLRDAHELVVSCQGKSVAYQLIMSGRQADRFREVQSRIDSYLILFPVISYIGVTRQLNRIYNVLVPDHATHREPSPLFQSTLVQQSEQVAQEVLPHEAEEFRLPEIVAATNNFALDTKIGEGSSAVVYKGRLQDGRRVAVKRGKHQKEVFFKIEEVFRTELAILSRIRHKHIIHLVGWCVQKEMDKHLLSFRRKKQDQEHLIVYEYLENGTLHDHLHRQSSSPVTLSWKMRIDVLLGVSRAIEHLHCHAVPPVIHRDIKSENILLDSSWVPCLTDFGLSITWHAANEDEVFTVVGTTGYLDPQYALYGHLEPASDIYGLGFVILEVLTGKKVITEGWMDLVSFALPIIEAGDLGELLDRRPVPEPTPQQLKALEHVAQTAACCVQMQGKDRPAISDVAASLEKALEYITLSTTLAGVVSLPVHFHSSRPCPRLCPEPAESQCDKREASEGVLSDSDIPEPR